MSYLAEYIRELKSLFKNAYLIEADDTYDQINVHLNSSAAMDKVKETLKQGPVSNWQEQPDFESQHEAFNNQAYALEKSGIDPKLHMGHYLSGSSYIGNEINKINQATGQNIDLKKLKDTYEITHPYEIHRVRYDKDLNGGHIGYQKIINDPHEFMNYTDKIGGIPLYSNRGILTSRISNIWPEAHIENKSPEHSITIEGNIHHYPVDKYGNILHDKAEKVGNFKRIIKLSNKKPSDNYVQHDELKFDDAHNYLKNSGFGTHFFNKSLQNYENMGIDHIKLSAGYANGGQAWARRGAVFVPNEDGSSEGRDINDRYELNLPHKLRSAGVKDYKETAQKILADLEDKQRTSMKIAGHTPKEINRHIESHGIDPYLLYNVHVNTPTGNHHIGHQLMYNTHYDAAIPVSKNSKYRRSLPYIEQMKEHFKKYNR